MALQHIRAFRADREKYGDQINQDIAFAIADAMGNDDSPATVAIMTLAEEARCHYNTADKRTKEMAAAGLIKIEKQGRFLCYSLVGKFEPVQYKSPPPDNGDGGLEKRIDSLESKVESLVKMVGELSHNLHTIVTSSSHDLHMTFTPADNENVNKEGKKGRREEEEEGRYISPKPPCRDEKVTLQELPPEAVPFPGREEIRQEMVSAISQEVKEIYAAGITDSDYNAAADGMVLKGVKPKQVKGFDVWWQINGFYPGKASIKTFVAEFDNFLNGVVKPKKPAVNGHQKNQIDEEFTADAIKNRLKRKKEETNEVA